jgi:hypothetical protein
MVLPDNLVQRPWAQQFCEWRHLSEALIDRVVKERRTSRTFREGEAEIA